MEWVLINKSREIVSKYTTKTSKGYGSEAAKFYFIGRKRLSEEKFDELWEVMSKKEYDLGEYAYQRKSSSDPSKQWWKEDKYLDIDSSNGE